jgi:hypothetical protein
VARSHIRHYAPQRLALAALAHEQPRTRVVAMSALTRSREQRLAVSHPRQRYCLARRACTGKLRGRGEGVSPFVSPSPFKRRCRAKAQRNHNPRVGGSSPSPGIESACKRASASPQAGEFPPGEIALRAMQSLPSDRQSTSWKPIRTGPRRVRRRRVDHSLRGRRPGQAPLHPQLALRARRQDPERDSREAVTAS